MEPTINSPILTQNNPPKTLVPPPFSFSGMGSGTSIITDSETGIESESRSRSKEVKTLQSGRWSARIKIPKHRDRVWVGTFNEQHEAARAHDIAALKFMGRNTPLLEDELNFINSKSGDELVDILRQHTYYDELHSFIKRKHATVTSTTTSTSRELLFKKVVTASDVRNSGLIIPKKHAVKYFPLSGKYELKLEDADEKVWRFEYGYTNSTDTYALNKGWSWFVKDKNLQAGDTVFFYRSTAFHNQLYIDFQRTSGQTTNGSLSGSGSGSGQQVGPAQKLRLFGVDIYV